MGRIRTLKPDFFRSRSLAKVTRDARLTFAGLWCEADDMGRGEADPRLLKGSTWPLDDDITPVDIAAHLSELVDTGHIVVYTAGDDEYYEVRNWEKHQAAAYRRGESKHPAPPPQPVEPPPHDKSCKKVQAAPEGVLEGKGRDVERKGDDDVAVTKESTPDDPSSSSGQHQRKITETCNRYANHVMSRPENHGKASGWRHGIAERTAVEQGWAIEEALIAGRTPKQIAGDLDANRPLIAGAEPPSPPLMPRTPPHPESCQCDGTEIIYVENGAPGDRRNTEARRCPGPRHLSVVDEPA